MKVVSIIVVVISLLHTNNAVATREQTLADGAGGAGDLGSHDKRLARSVRASDVSWRSDPTCPPTSHHSEFPCEDDVDSPEMTNPPAAAPVAGRYEEPTVAPSTPTLSPTSLDCASTDGSFGNVIGDNLIVVPVTYMYEMETVPATTEFEIENEILPSLEVAILDSILLKAFPDRCGPTSSGKRRLRARRLDVTGISTNPPDSINPELQCEAGAVSSPDNGCVVVDGEIMLFTDSGNAEEEKALIKELIKMEMDSGAYNYVSDKIVRLRYLDLSLLPPESNLPEDGNDNGNEDVSTGDGNDVRIGVFVGIFSVLLVVSVVIYSARRRTRHADDETDLQTNNDIISAQTQSFNAQNELYSVQTESVNGQSESLNVQLESFNVASESFNDASVMPSLH